MVGWLTGTFGLFGTPVGVVARPYLNYLGFFLACVGMAIFAQVKTEGEGEGESGGGGDVEMKAAADSFELAQSEADDFDCVHKHGVARAPNDASQHRKGKELEIEVEGEWSGGGRGGSCEEREQQTYHEDGGAHDELEENAVARVVPCLCVRVCVCMCV